LQECIHLFKPCCTNNNGSLNGICAGECYEQGIMNIVIKEKYYRNIYIDYDRHIVDNICYDINSDYRSNSFIVHLAGRKNEFRNEYFNKVNKELNNYYLY